MILPNILLAFLGIATSILYMKNLENTCKYLMSPEGFRVKEYIFNRLFRLVAFCLITFIMIKVTGTYVLSFLLAFLATNLVYTASRSFRQN